MMRRAGTLFRTGLGGAQIESAIDLHRVHADDLAAELLGELQRDSGFAGGSRAGEEDGFCVLRRHGANHFAFSPGTAGAGAFSGVSFSCHDIKKRRPTPTQMALSAMLKAGNPISVPLPRRWT